MSESAPNVPRQTVEGLNLQRVITLVLVIGFVLISGALWLIISERKNNHSAASFAERRFGLRAPVPGRLDARFSDKNQDLIADPPDSDFLIPTTLVFSYIAAGPSTQAPADWQPLVERLSAAAGIPVEYRQFETVAEQLDALRNGELHVTALNTGNVPRAVNECGFVPVSARANADGDWRITMKLIVPRDSPIQTVKDLRKRSVTFTNPSSFSGFKYAVVLLETEFGLRLGRDYEYRFSTSHDNSIEMTAAGEAEAAVVASDLLEAAYAAGTVNRDQIREVYTSPPFPAAVFGYAYNLPPELAEKIREFLLDGDFSDTPIVGPGGTASTKLAATDYKADWQGVREVDARIAVEDTPAVRPVLEDAQLDEALDDAPTDESSSLEVPADAANSLDDDSS